MRALEGIEREQDRRRGEHREARVVDLDPAEHVAEAAEADHEHGLDQPVPHDHPQQVADVAGRQRVQVDAAEDGRQRDDDDGSVEGGHEHGCGRVGQGHPAVAVTGAGRQLPGHQLPALGRSALRWPVIRWSAPVARAVGRPPGAGGAPRA